MGIACESLWGGENNGITYVIPTSDTGSAPSSSQSMAMLELVVPTLLAFPWANVTMYHINPLTYDPSQLSNKDTGDLAGDLFFDMQTLTTQAFACAPGVPRTPGVICNNKETSGHDIGVTQVTVELDLTWGPYGTCNICVNGSSPLNHSHACTKGEYVCDCENGVFPPKKVPCTAHVGWENTSAFLGSEGIGRFCGFGHGTGKIAACAAGAAADKLQGIWFSMPAAGECKGASREGCHWRLQQVVKRVRRDCHADTFLSAVERRNPTCFQKCGTPRNTTSLCWAGCFVDTALGSKARSKCDPTGGMTATELENAWAAPFASCPSV